MVIYKAFQVEAAHRLPNLPSTHKCSRLHGHSFRIELHIEGPLDPKLGWVMDFADVKAAFFQLLFAQHDAQLARENLKTVEDLVKLVSARVSTREAPKFAAKPLSVWDARSSRGGSPC